MAERIDITWEIKKRELKDKVKNAWNGVCRFVDNNKEIIAVSLPIAGKVVYDLVKQHKRNSYLREERELKDQHIYDPRLGIYFKTRKPLSTNQRLEFAARREKGESVSDILRDMRIL